MGEQPGWRGSQGLCESRWGSGCSPGWSAKGFKAEDHSQMARAAALWLAKILLFYLALPWTWGVLRISALR